jgi:hypothetical protein
VRIHLLCDHKWRDLPNLTAIKIHLERLGHRVFLSTTKDAMPLLQWFRPDCVVINHLFGAKYRELARRLREVGVAVVLLPTEGAMRPEYLTIAAGEFTDFSACELFLNWSENAARLLRDRWQVGEAGAPAIGCTRFDLYSPNFGAAIKSRDAFCRQYGLDPKRAVVTWATQYGYAHLTAPSVEREKFLREAVDVGVAACCERIGLDVAEMPRLHAEGREATSEAFFVAAGKMPQVQFVIRPHPVEAREYYRRKIQERGLDNVVFCPNDYIWNVLNASDVHLHRQCTTAVEAWMWGKPTIEMGMDDVPQWRWSEREAGSDVVRDASTLMGTIRDYLNGRTVEAAAHRYRCDYIKTWFGAGAGDGRRCANAAATISRFLERRGRQRRYFSSLGAVRAKPRDSVGAALRYMLGKRPNERLFGKTRLSAGPEDKLITRRDVAAYERVLSAIK